MSYNVKRMIIPLTSKGNKWFAGVLQAGGILFISVVVSFIANNWRENKLPIIDAGSPKFRLTPAVGKSLIMSLDDAKKHFFNHSAVFLDARSSENYEQGHIKGAYNLSPENMEEKFPEVMENIGPESLIIVYCDGENHRSGGDLSVLLSEFGFIRVRLLFNGWSLWRDNHLPVERIHRNIS
jgi:3-mercaptopyruvate sulfurtransferase SseA